MGRAFGITGVRKGVNRILEKKPKGKGLLGRYRRRR